MEFILRIFVNWGIVGGISVFVTGLIGKLIAAKTQRVSCAGVMSILNGVLAVCFGLPSALEIKSAQCHCEFCIGHAENLLFLVAVPLFLLMVICFAAGMKHRRQRAEGM